MYEYWCIYCTLFLSELKALGNSTQSNRGWRCSGYIKEEIVSMEIESAVWSLPERITAATRCQSGHETEILWKA